MNKKILKLIEQRLLIGEQKYGNENVTNDGRDFLKESLDEKEKNNSRHKINTTVSTMDIR